MTNQSDPSAAIPESTLSTPTEAPSRLATLPTTLEWARSRDGWIFGVCALFAKRFSVNENGVRLAWFLAVLFFGSGVFAYLLLGLSLPLAGDISRAYRRRILGVCRQIALKTDREVGMIRLMAVLSLVVSFGLTIFLYIALAFFMTELPTEPDHGVRASN